MEQVTDGSSEACRLFKVDFPNDSDYPIACSKTNANGGMTMRTIFSILLIMVFVQTTVSVRAEQQDVKVTAVMKGSATISGQKIEYPKTDKAEMASVLVDIQPGKENGRHMHPVPTYVHVLEGTLTVEFEDGARQTFKAGSGFLEVVNTWHSAKNLGEVPVRLLVVFAGEEGTLNLIRPEKQQTSDTTN
jgi:quercetin dioxygenase-like cupin family protein